MGSILKPIAVMLVILGLISTAFGAYLMFIMVPNEVENATFPDDFDDHFTYGGYIDKLNTTSGAVETTGFTVDRHIKVDEKLDGGNLRVDECIKARVNGTDPYVYIPDFDRYNTYEVDEKDLTISHVTDNAGYEEIYTEEDNVNWIFPHPVDKDNEFKIWSMNILNYSEAHYLGTEDRGGVECYVFKGNESHYEIPIPDSVAASLGSMAPDSRMTLSLWEKAWVHPMTGTIVDYSKEIKQYLYLPELPDIPEIKYPSDLISTTGFEGAVILFDQDNASFNTFNGVEAVRTIEVVDSDEYDLTANETVEVITSDGTPLPMLNSAVQVIFDARDGTHNGLGRTGNYLFPPTGVEQKNYTIWDDGFGSEVTAVFEGEDTTNFAPFTVYTYHIYEENLTYLAGGFSTLDMVYHVEPQTGMVLDVSKKLLNWRPQPARRLPLDTDLINKTVHLNATITTINPIAGTLDEMDIIVVQEINCTGYSDATFSIAKIVETVTKYLPNMTQMAPSVVSKFGVNAVTMEYSHVNGWSDVDREGVFTFPIGLLDEEGNVTGTFKMFNSDLMMSFNATLDSEIELEGLSVAKYVMALEDIPLTEAQVTAVIGEELGIPGATFDYGCDFTYLVDVNSGTLIDVERDMTITVYPPTYEYLYDNLDSTTTVKGIFMGENITVNRTMKGTDDGDGFASINVTTTYKYDDGADFLPILYGETRINVSSHEAVNESGDGQGYYILFPPDPTQKAAYPIMLKVGDYILMGEAVKGEETDTTVAYNWTGETIIDGGLVNETMAGVNLTLTINDNYLLDKVTGSVLDASTEMILVNETMFVNEEILLLPTDEAKADMALSNKVIGWALSGNPVDILSTSAELYEPEMAYAIGKAAATNQLLLIADGLMPALDLQITFNATTKAEMKATAEATIALLQQLPLLRAAHGLNTLLASKDNMVAYVYYKQVDEDVDENKGSVEYWGEFAKEKEDGVYLFGTTIPLFLYVIALVFIIIAVALLVVKPKKEEEEPAPTEEEPSDEEPGEESEGETEPEPPEEGEETDEGEDGQEPPEEDDTPDESEAGEGETSPEETGSEPPAVDEGAGQEEAGEGIEPPQPPVL